jgi:putative flippase GtrA
LRNAWFKIRRADQVFFRFALVGLLNSCFGVLCYYILLSVGLSYGAALTVGTLIGVLFNFKTTGALVFGSHDNRLIFRFVGVYLMVYCFSYLGLWLLDRAGFDPYTAGLLTLVPSAGLAFLLNKFFVFQTAQ